MPPLPNSPNYQLATYGTLAPGRANNHQLAELDGRWIKGTVKGRLIAKGWGADLGYPGLHLDPLGQSFEVDIFESKDLPAHWDRLDDFEGPGYCRVQTEVNTQDGKLNASIYVLAGEQ